MITAKKIDTLVIALVRALDSLPETDRAVHPVAPDMARFLGLPAHKVDASCSRLRARGSVKGQPTSCRGELRWVPARREGVGL